MQSFLVVSLVLALEPACRINPGSMWSGLAPCIVCRVHAQGLTRMPHAADRARAGKWGQFSDPIGPWARPMGSIGSQVNGIKDMGLIICFWHTQNTYLNNGAQIFTFHISTLFKYLVFSQNLPATNFQITGEGSPLRFLMLLCLELCTDFALKTNKSFKVVFLICCTSNWRYILEQ